MTTRQHERRIASGLVAIALAATLAGCGDDADDTAEPARTVRTITVAAGSPVAQDRFSGSIEAEEDVAVSFRLPGRLLERAVDRGDRVEAGQLLAALEPDDQLNDLAIARAGLVAAESTLRTAEGRHDRLAVLFERERVPASDFEAATQALRAARAQLDVARSRLDSAERMLSFTRLKADAPAIVAEVSAEPGEVVAAGRPVVRLARRDGRDAVFQVPADVAQRLYVGTTLTISAIGVDAVAKARVREIAPVADAVTRQFEVRAGLTEPSPAFRLGIGVTATLDAAAGSAVRVPASALLRTAEATGVWIVDPEQQTVSFRAVDVGDVDPGTATVTAGLAAGDIIVTAGVSSLTEGRAVRLSGDAP
jgi:RND family efflux transporter MFP subunit